MKRTIFRLTILSLLLFPFGCRPSASAVETGDVTIHLTRGESPVTGASVQLVIDGEGKGAFGDVDQEGNVTFSDVETGSYTVVILPASQAGDPTPGESSVITEIDVPEQFQSQSTSPLKAEVKTGTNSFEFDIQQ